MALSGVSTVKSKKRSWNISTALASAASEWLLMLILSTSMECVRNCLFSFAAINKSNAETYRLLVGKLGEDSGFVLDQDSQLDGHSSVTRQCSCCNEPWIPRGYCQKLMRAISAGSGAADLDVPLSDSIKHDCSNLEKSKQSIPLRTMLSDDNGENAVHEDLAVEYLKSEPCTVSLVDDSVTEKLIDPASSPEPSILASKVQSDVIRVPVEHEKVPQKASKEREIISPDDVLQISYAKETPPEASDENRIISVDNVLPSTQRCNPAKISQESELISIVDSLPSTNGAENPVQGLKESCVSREEEAWQTSVTGGEDFGKGETQPARRNDTASEINPSSSDNGQQPANSLDLSDAYKLAVGNRGRQLSGVLAEQRTVKGFSKA
ncbi:hypothetical protein OIU78_022638 [Salix suchowensis]|nr:hypothetical protein OIU78_022638 [Salix suchowensis]